MTDPIDRRANRAADSIRSATSDTDIPPISSITRRATTDRVLGVAFIVALVSGVIAVGAMAGSGNNADDAAQSATTSSTPSSSSISSSTTITTLAPTTTVLGILRDEWQGSGRLLIEFFDPDTLLATALAELTDGAKFEVHFRDDAPEMALRVRFSGTDASEVLVGGIPVVVRSDGTWSSELDLTLFPSDSTVVVFEVDGLAYGVEITLGDEDPIDPDDTTSTSPTTVAPTTTIGN